ncbi:MAG: FAD:protein FMN transferase [Alistipes sp.]|nr:FAD:protein FMN transferase [Alistipes sp.]
MAKTTKAYILFAAICVVATLLVGCQGCKKQYTVVESTALGTFVQVKCSPTITQRELSKLILDIDTEAKESMSIFEQGSLLSKINRNECDSLDSHIMANLALAKRYYELSNGYYDVTVKPLTSAWGFAAKDEKRNNPNIDSLLEFVGFDKIAINDCRITKSDSRVQVDLNSIAKGYVVDLVAEALSKRGVESYMVNIGGEIRCKGMNPEGNEWHIGIETPYEGNFEQNSLEKIIPVSNCAVATSGNYRRYYTSEEGLKVCHTINPKTGYSVLSNLLSATVVAPTCAEADAAATMFMAMGSEGGALELAKQCEKDYGWSYYFIYADGEGYRVECSARFR